MLTPERHGNLKWVPAGVEIDLSKPIVIVPIMTEKDLDKLDPEMREKLVWGSNSTVIPPVVGNEMEGFQVLDNGQLVIISGGLSVLSQGGQLVSYLNDGPVNPSSQKEGEARKFFKNQLPWLIGSDIGQAVMILSYSDSRDMTLFEIYGYIGSAPSSWKREVQIDFLPSDKLLFSN